MEGLGVDLDAERAGLVGEFAQNVALGADGDGAARVGQVWIGARAVDCEDEGLVLDGAGDRESAPVVLTGAGPVGAVGEDLSAQFESPAEELGESQVVADDGADGQVVPLVGEDVLTGGEEFGLATEGEWVDLAVLAEELFIRGGDGGAVEGLVAIAGADGSAALDRDAKVVGEGVKETERAVLGVCVFFGAEAEARVEELGQEDKISRVGVGLVEGSFDEAVVGLVVFPDEVELQEVGSHCGTIAGGWVGRLGATIGPEKHVSPASNNQPRLVLASQSPRRRQLLTEAGYAFTVPGRLVDDGRLNSGAVSPGDWVMALAYLKAAGASGGIEPGSVVLGADTICVSTDGARDELIGQPRDAEHAEAILRSFIGREHSVVTGVALLSRDTGERELMLDEAAVTWGEVSDEEIASYIDTGLWRGKAGAYNLRERLEAGWAIEYEGDPTSIMGLPMDLLNVKLPAWGIEPGVAA